MVISDPYNADMDTATAAALAMAERIDGPPSLVSALRARQLVRSGVDGNTERVELGARMLALGTSTHPDPDAVLWGRIWRLDAFLQAGRVTDAERELDLLEPVVARLHLIRSRGAPAFGRGNFAETARLNEEAIRTAEHHTGALLAATAVRFTPNTFAGRTDGIEQLAGPARPGSANGR